ncbi:pilus assembly protein [Bordetella hinzii]|nr:pilus assembly protein [Bordetella hinzii]
MLVITGALALLWLGVQQLSESRMAVLETAQASRRWAFALARAETPPTADRGLSLSVLKPAQARDSAVSPSGQALVSEWLDLPAHWAAVRAHAGRGMPARQTVLAAGAGHASDARTAQQRLGRSTHGWGHAADDSRRQARALDPALRGLDRPWGQRRVHTDWLMPWADVVPDGRRLPRGRR